jgi:hypothetical protein
MNICHLDGGNRDHYQRYTKGFNHCEGSQTSSVNSRSGNVNDIKRMWRAHHVAGSSKRDYLIHFLFSG